MMAGHPCAGSSVRLAHTQNLPFNHEYLTIRQGDTIDSLVTVTGVLNKANLVHVYLCGGPNGPMGGFIVFPAEAGMR